MGGRFPRIGHVGAALSQYKRGHERGNAGEMNNAAAHLIKRAPLYRREREQREKEGKCKGR